MSMYEKMLQLVMADDVTLEVWKRFRTYFESLPISSFKELKKRSDDFAEAAHHVASVLPFEDIEKDLVLLLAYQEINYPEAFS